MAMWSGDVEYKKESIKSSVAKARETRKPRKGTEGSEGRSSVREKRTIPYCTRDNTNTGICKGHK